MQLTDAATRMRPAELMISHGVAPDVAADLVARAFGTVLDLGAGPGSAIDPGSTLRVRDLAHGTMLEVDFFRAHAFPAPSVRALRLRADASRALPLADGSIDLAVCMHVLEHLASPDGALREIARVLRRDGRAVLAIPNGRAFSDWVFRAFYRATHDRREPGYDPHRQTLTAADFARLLAAAGLRPLQQITIGESFAWLHKHPRLRSILAGAFRAGRRLAPERCAYGWWCAVSRVDAEA